MRWPLIFAFALASCTVAFSYPTFSYSFRHYEQAPVLVVGRVLEIQLGAVVSEPDISSNRDVREATATVEVLRTRSSTEDLPAPSVGERMLLRIYRHVDGDYRSMHGPSLPAVEEGRTYVFPLRGREGALWRLAGDIGELSTILATAEPLGRAQPAAASRDFLLEETVGVLVHGAAADVKDSARWLYMFIRKEQAPDFLARLEAAIDDDPTRLAFLEVLCTFGQPHFGEPQGAWVEPPLDVARWASERLAGSPQHGQLLAAALLANMELAYRAAPLLEAADLDLVIPGVREALHQKRLGALYLAEELIRANRLELLSAAMTRAIEIADDPAGKIQELQLAGRFVSERGSAAELKTYASLVRKYRDTDPDFYNHLWQLVSLESNPNAEYVLAVVLEDRRIAFRDVRYADLAAGALQRQTGEDFGVVNDAPLFARDRAIARALAWLRERGYTQ